VKEVSKSTTVPVTVKIRKGWDDDSVNATEVAKIAEENGASAITVHGRTRKEFYSGKADLDIIKAVVESVNIPVIGNGDIIDGKSAKNMLDYTGCKGIMIGRGVQGNPWIFREVIEYLKTGTDIPKPDIHEKCDMMRKHIELLCKFKGERRGIPESRKHMAWYVKGLRDSTRFKDEIFKADSLDRMFEIIDYIEERQEISDKF